MAEARAEQARLRSLRPAPPPLASVAPQGSNIRREWVARPATEAAEDEVSEGETSRVESSTRAVGDYAPAPFDEDGPIWPDEVAEAAFIGEPEPSGGSVEPERPGALPTLESLVARLDETTKSALEELFRARFVSVRRVQAGWLKDSPH